MIPRFEKLSSTRWSRIWVSKSMKKTKWTTICKITQSFLSLRLSDSTEPNHFSGAEINCSKQLNTQDDLLQFKTSDLFYPFLTKSSTNKKTENILLFWKNLLFWLDLNFIGILIKSERSVPRYQVASLINMIVQSISLFRPRKWVWIVCRDRLCN